MRNIEDVNTRINNVRKEKYEMLLSLPENNTLYKCNSCRFIFDITKGGQLNILTILSSNCYVYCPKCGVRNPELMCKTDAYSIYLKLQGIQCRNGEVLSGTDLCPACNKPICPECYNHSVISLSRVTGYVQDISGWNNAKRQELLDRQRYAI